MKSCSPEAKDKHSLRSPESFLISDLPKVPNTQTRQLHHFRTIARGNVTHFRVSVSHRHGRDASPKPRSPEPIFVSGENLPRPFRISEQLRVSRSRSTRSH